MEAGCPGLQSINVNGCVTLFRLALEQQPLLERMEASGCKALRHGASSSNVLRACFLQSCPRLVVSLCSTVPEGHFSELQVMLAIMGAKLPGTNHWFETRVHRRSQGGELIPNACSCCAECTAAHNLPQAFRYQQLRQFEGPAAEDAGASNQ